jgi:hypothetical protein
MVNGARDGRRGAAVVSRRASKVDGNQGDIDEAARGVGAVILRASMAPDLGFDRLYVYRGHAHIVEVKNPKLPPSARRLTENERRVKAAVEAVGGVYNIVESDEDLMRVFGLA